MYMHRILELLSMLRQHTKKFPKTLSEIVVAEYGNDPFLVLISCLLSLRARDSMTIGVVRDLFAQACSPKSLLDLDIRVLEGIIRPIGFYNAKAKILRHVSAVIIKQFCGQVPQTYQELISIKGIGPKTANLVLGVAFNQPAICVDVHVHRIANRLGLVTTKTPEQTEAALKKIFDRNDWIELNKLFVVCGQNICMPRNPRCVMCPLVCNSRLEFMEIKMKI